MCVKTLARLLTRRFGSRCIIALQEIQRWPSTASCGALAHGYRLIHDDGSACGFLLPLSAQKQLKTNMTHFSSSSCGVVIGDFGLVSSYLADIAKPHELFMDSIKDAGNISFIRLGKRKVLVWALDNNTDFDGLEDGCLVGNCV